MKSILSFRQARIGVGVWLLAVVAASLTGAAPAPAADEDTSDENLSFNWMPYHDAREEARLVQKPLLMYFTKSHCSQCSKLERETFGDGKVLRQVRENFVATRLTANEYQALMVKYEVEVLPTVWFVEPDGRGLTSVRGYTTPDRLLMVMEYISSRAFESIGWEDWKEGIRPEPEPTQPGETLLEDR